MLTVSNFQAIKSMRLKMNIKLLGVSSAPFDSLHILTTFPIVDLDNILISFDIMDFLIVHCK